MARVKGFARRSQRVAQDADSDGYEGKFFVWTPGEIRSVLGGASGWLIVSKSKSSETNDAQLFMDAQGVTDKGNFKEVVDNATPLGSAMATNVLFKLAAYTGDPKYADASVAALAPLQPALAQAPTGFAWWLCALNFELAPPKETAIVRDDAQ